ncbi:MAG: guanylate kinase [Paludibacter sp.]|nr:guanylate kinase [Bacteroidales bacterium]MCM1069277.1 guanylate kinase [Prevotella sp.]MCM1353740.1 guanylate kinase [Bacteroides sp.]MCM1442192.1 guanylate kinase [Muribaculum sp.]MCM1482154.1 guanylate kinase [Paludibacter sp.]
MILIFCAPSGSGKSTFVNYLLKQYSNFELSISATSRPPRGQEQHGREYYFLSAEAFKELIASNSFVEYEEVYPDYFYGTLQSEIERIQNNQHHVIFDVDVKGGINLKKKFGKEALSVFIQPPSIEELRKRLTNRGTDSAEMIERRIAKASKEMEDAPLFDEILINDDLATAQSNLQQLLAKYNIVCCPL